MAAVLVIAGDILDHLCLRFALRMLDRGGDLPRLKLFTMLSAGVQAVTIVAAISLAWDSFGAHSEPLLAIAMLTGVAVNGGVALPFHSGAAIVRMGIYGAAILVQFGAEFLVVDQDLTKTFANFLGALILAYTVYLFTRAVNANFLSSQATTLELMQQRQKLERTNRELKEKQIEARKLALVAQHANDSVIIINSDGLIDWVNDAFSEITGYSFNEAVGTAPGALLNAPDTDLDVVAHLATTILAGETFRGEILNQHKQGHQFWIETNQVPVIGADGEIEMVVAIERDISAMRQHAMELEAAREAAEDATRAKSDFLATMSHEIRTPMNGVLGMSDLLSQTTLNDEQNLFVQTIQTSARTLLGLINDILDLSKLDARRMELSPVVFDVHACFSDTIRLLRGQAQEKSVGLSVDIDGTVPRWLSGDDRRIQQILFNLVGNAIKFTETGQVTVRVTCERNCKNPVLRFEVEDTGIGIPEAKLDKIFERFSQAEASTTRRFGGTGLGLTIARMLANAMGGEILVRSKVGQGTLFTVFLHLDPVPSEVPIQERNAAPMLLIDPKSGEPEHVPRDTLRVLVAEDNKVNRLVIAKFLKSMPVEVSFAHDGREAVERALEQEPDLIFMDMSMPVMNGLDATREIRAKCPVQPRIVALTANAFESDRDACLAAGMDGFLTKPLSRAELLAVLEKLQPRENHRMQG
ncbi:response regulator [Rhodobacteraceae bacterium M382]|nr:response regulator [Rhodobacteraceae bacterium M382]